MLALQDPAPREVTAVRILRREAEKEGLASRGLSANLLLSHVIVDAGTKEDT